ncbi:hypothetical protein P175DRAFT_0505470 [Aspergillus ochraceoroseus IBT 24754]|uniref:Protein kinase domain-containing protein n=1 Tax=Aspergillus ochraceoroseus IBT 24754 TaxID=1392256 RepID=A0A2T5M534_9EURO|nr:uncharacterized protein P175DRAFT_0505470 [Aspergillus ochraceoroseus IBT 24754]PTU23650.1 hypothetical protein P175DRAFT_0505470 [Aspergillus ochraceoroseus IBT 24754]
MMEFNNVIPTEINFERRLFSSEFSVIFLVTIRNQKCIMKVHHGRGPRRYYEPEDRELDIHVLETTAYTRLKDKGLCDQGIVPYFLGSIRKFDPSSCQPHLKMFLHDEYLPSALFLEYIPNLEMIQLHNYTQQRMHNILSGIREIHNALVQHNDPKPRNMMVVGNERVVWIDFDRAETYDEEQITDEQRYLLQEEEEIVIGFKECIEADCTKGKLDEAYLFYCT